MVDIKRHTDILLALFVLCVTALLLVPLPTPLLDVLIVLNLSLSLLLLVVGLYLTNPISLLSFPSLLLLATLFRLSLNVASTRLILSQGDAGRVIEAFGSFLVRGEIFVGLVVFAILTIVNLLVIAKGAGRVAEVSARFALDALPGKQMAIDADLRSGLISPEESQQRREDLRKESQLYGSMDGAMNFVQGDAIAGVFLIIVNIFGGMYVGLSQGLGLADAAHTYTILTVGDGLVTQIPALMVSICAGIIVTRVASSDRSTLGADVGAQLFTNPFYLRVSGGIVLLAGLLPGLPTVPFLLVGLTFLGLSLVGRGSSARSVSVSHNNEPSLSVTSRSRAALPGSSDSGSVDSAVVVELDERVLWRNYRSYGQRFRLWSQDLIKDVQEQSGLSIPEPIVAPLTGVRAGSYRVICNGSVLHQGEIPVDLVLVEMSAQTAKLLDIPVVEQSGHPVSGTPVIWTHPTDRLRKIIEGAGIRVFEGLQVVLLRMVTSLLEHPENVLSITEVHALLKTSELKYPGLLTEAFGKGGIHVARLTEVLQSTVRHGISIRDIRRIIEGIALYAVREGVDLSRGTDLDVADLVTALRSSRTKEINAKLASHRGSVKLIVPSSEVLSKMKRSDSGLGVEIGTLKAEAAEILERGVGPLSLVLPRSVPTSTVERLRGELAGIFVIVASDLEATARIEPVLIWQ